MNTQTSVSSWKNSLRVHELVSTKQMGKLSVGLWRRLPAVNAPFPTDGRMDGAEGRGGRPRRRSWRGAAAAAVAVAVAVAVARVSGTDVVRSVLAISRRTLPVADLASPLPFATVPHTADNQ